MLEPILLFSLIFAGIYFRYLLFVWIFTKKLIPFLQVKGWAEPLGSPTREWAGQRSFEQRHSFLSTFVFAFVGTLWILGYREGLTKITWEISPLWTFIVAPLLLLVIHETYFYWTHRLLHLKVFYRYHEVHHRSRQTSAWASFSFHGFEALINAVILPIITLFLPLHPVVLGVYLTLMSFSAVSNHSGFEVLAKLPNLKKIFISGEHHFVHHQRPGSNFGLFIRFWDLVMNTEKSAH